MFSVEIDQDFLSEEEKEAEVDEVDFLVLDDKVYNLPIEGSLSIGRCKSITLLTKGDSMRCRKTDSDDSYVKMAERGH